MLSGGISSGKRTAPGTAIVEPIAWLTPSGKWKDIPCSSNHQTGCPQFEKQFVQHSHVYKVVASDGKGATIHAPATKLSECYDYSVVGTYSGTSISNWTIAAYTTDIFGDSPPLRPLDADNAAAVRKALSLLDPKRLESTDHLHLYSLRLENTDMVVVQRAFADVVETETNPISEKLVFGIGKISREHFHIFHWKEGDDDERILGTIRLNSGREFLITVANDSESHVFHAYGIRNGHLALLYSGGGSSC